MRMGTPYFPTMGHAVKYYADQGFTPKDVADKVVDGEIFIGKPTTCEPDERIVLDTREGRYFIEHD